MVEKLIVDEWISIKERLPTSGSKVLCSDGDLVYIKYFEKDTWYDGDTYCYCPVGVVTGIIRWKPLPKP